MERNVSLEFRWVAERWEFMPLGNTSTEDEPIKRWGNSILAFGMTAKSVLILTETIS